MRRQESNVNGTADLAEEATKTVLEQAEVLCAGWA